MHIAIYYAYIQATQHTQCEIMALSASGNTSQGGDGLHIARQTLQSPAHPPGVRTALYRALVVCVVTTLGQMRLQD